MKITPLQFVTVTFIDELDGTERKAIISSDRIDRLSKAHTEVVLAKYR